MKAMFQAVGNSHQVRRHSQLSQTGQAFGSKRVYRKTGIKLRAGSNTADQGIPFYEKALTKLGFDCSYGYFGFVPFAEKWVARWTMFGIGASMLGELITGKGTLAQVGVTVPSTVTLAAVLLLTGVPLIIASFWTNSAIRNSTMPSRQLAMYRKFLALDSDDEEDESMLTRIRRNAKEDYDLATMSDDPAVDTQQAEEQPKASAVATKEDSPTKSPLDDLLTKVQPSPSTATSETMREERRDYLIFSIFETLELSAGRIAMLVFWLGIGLEAGYGTGFIQTYGRIHDAMYGAGGDNRIPFFDDLDF